MIFLFANVGSGILSKRLKVIEMLPSL